MKRNALAFLAVLGAVLPVAGITATTSVAAKFTAGLLSAPFDEETRIDHAFSITGGQVKCSSVTFTGVTTGTPSGGLGHESESWTVTPGYSSCVAFGFSATVTNSGCKYTLEADGEMDIFGAGCKLKFLVDNWYAGCEVIMEGQEEYFAVSYTNDSNHLIVNFYGTDFEAKVTRSWGLCPLTVGSHELIYTGQSTLRAAPTVIRWDA
jgi:hypothetical protein